MFSCADWRLIQPVEPDWTLDDFPEDYVLYRLVDPDPPKGRTGNDKYLFGAVAGMCLNLLHLFIETSSR